jgi:hypothetical protein
LYQVSWTGKIQRLTGFEKDEIKKGKIVGSYLSFINLNLIVEFGRMAIEEILSII